MKANDFLYGKRGVRNLQGLFGQRGDDTNSKKYDVPERAEMPEFDLPTKQKKLIRNDTKLSSSVLNKADAAMKKTNVDMRGMEALRNQALNSSANSPWLKLQNQRLDMQKQSDIDEANSANMGREAQARASLSSKGGLSGGAAERLASGSSLNSMLDRQRIQRDINQGRLGAETSAEEQRLDTLRTLPGQELALNQQNLGKQQYVSDLRANIANANMDRKLSEMGKLRENNKWNYEQKMAEWAAANQANSIQDAGKKENGIGTHSPGWNMANRLSGGKLGNKSPIAATISGGGGK